MTNKEFIDDVQKSCHLDTSQCTMLLGSLQKVLGKAGVDQMPVVLSGLGFFTSHKHPEYIQEDPQTGKMTLYPPRITYRMQADYENDAVPVESLLAEYSKIGIDEAGAFVEGLVSCLNRHLKQKEEVELPGIGTFRKVLTHNSELQHISFLPADQLKQLVNAPFECFEPMVIAQKEESLAAAAAGSSLEKPVPAEKTVAESPTENPAPAEEIVAESPVENPAPVIEIKEEDPVPPVVVEGLKKDTAEKKPTPVVVEPKKAEPFKEKEPEDKNSGNGLLYGSITLILMSCGFLVWMMFGNDETEEWSGPLQEATIAMNNDLLPSATVDLEVEELPTEEGDILDSDESEEDILENEEAENEEAENDEPKTFEEIKRSDEKTDVKPEVKAEIKPEVKAEIKPEIKPVAAQKEEPKVTQPKLAKEFHRMLGADGKPATVVLKPGERLTLIALEHFGDKAFWPYIFEVNSDRLKAPNLVQSGMTLYLPDPVYYGIDKNSQESLSKAKNLGAKLLK